MVGGRECHSRPQSGRGADLVAVGQYSTLQRTYAVASLSPLVNYAAESSG
jgi:hypothetical protein